MKWENQIVKENSVEEFLQWKKNRREQQGMKQTREDDMEQYKGDKGKMLEQ